MHVKNEPPAALPKSTAALPAAQEGKSPAMRQLGRAAKTNSAVTLAIVGGLALVVLAVVVKRVADSSHAPSSLTTHATSVTSTAAAELPIQAPTPQPPPAPPPPQLHGLNERVQLGNFAYVVSAINGLTELATAFKVEKPEDGAMFIVVSYTIENLGNQTETVLADDFRLVDTQGRQFRPSSHANTALALQLKDTRKDLIVSELQPGIKHVMGTVFEVPLSVTKTGFKIVIPDKGFGSNKVELGMFTMADAKQ